MTAATFATELRARRQAGRLTLRELATATGLHAATLSRYERGIGEPSLSGALAIARGLGEPLAALTGEAR